MVDDSDATILATYWQTASGTTWEMGDFNADGAVDDFDATLLATNWRKFADVAATVPEPSSFALITVIAGAVVLLRGRRCGYS